MVVAIDNSTGQGVAQRAARPAPPSRAGRGSSHGAADPAVVDALTNVKGATAHAYGLKDSTGNQMASLHLLDADAADAEYYAVYMTNVRARARSERQTPAHPSVLTLSRLLSFVICSHLYLWLRVPSCAYSQCVGVGQVLATAVRELPQ